jgi:hypothetical protein
MAELISGEVPAMNFKFHGMGSGTGAHAGNWKRHSVAA